MPERVLMSVSNINATGTWSWVYNQQTPANSKADAINDTAAATQAVKQANQVASEQQASTRGDSQSINKLV